MEEFSTPLHIARLILKDLEGRLEPSGREELDRWLSREDNKALYGRILRKDIREKQAQAAGFHPEEGWKRLEREVPFSRRRPVLRTLLQAAAVVLVFLAGAALYLHQPDRDSRSLQAAAEVLPGSSKATLITDAGRAIPLDGQEEILLRELSPVPLRNVDNTLKLQPSTPVPEAATKYQTLEVPRGGEYRLVLSDGSAVWLNADSRIRFPLAFTGSRREVFLEGEACFDVVHDPEHPFTVTSGNISVEVLGTRFNLKAYGNEPTVSTTLERGSVRALDRISGRSLLLRPDQQCIYTRSSGEMVRRQVDAGVYLGWTGKKFIFDNEPLEEIMNQLERWYDVRVSYGNERIRHYRFTGHVDRFDRISTLLGMIEKTYPVRFDIIGRDIYIRE